MTHTTLALWKQNIAIRLMTDVPTMDLDSGISAAENYLSQTGGWLPDDPGNPVDLGKPVSGLSDTQIVAVILNDIQQSQYQFDAVVTVPISLTMFTNLSPGLDASQIKDTILTAMRNYIERSMADLPIHPNVNASSYTSVSSNVIGITTGPQRVAYNAGISADPVPILSKALQQARSRFGLSDLWNFSNIYARDTNTAGAVLQLYISGFDVVDVSETRRLVVEFHLDNGTIVSGILN